MEGHDIVILRYFKIDTRVFGFVACVFFFLTGYVVGQETSIPPTKTIIGDLLEIDRDLYIVRGERGEIQIEATYKTDVTEEFKFGDRIKALVLMNNRALKIERAGPNDVPGVVENRAVASEAPVAKKAEKATTKGTNQGKTKALEQSVQPKKPSTKTIVGDLLDIDRDLYIVRGERGEIQIEATYKTDVTEEFKFGDRIKALVLMNNKALKIERAGPNDVPGVVENQAVASEALVAKEEKKSETKGATQEKDKALEQSVQPKKADRKTIIGDLLEIDRDLYIVRGERGEIQIEATYKTDVTEEFKFGDRIKALVLMNNKALKIERAGPNDVPGVVVHND